MIRATLLPCFGYSVKGNRQKMNAKIVIAQNEPSFVFDFRQLRFQRLPVCSHFFLVAATARLNRRNNLICDLVILGGAPTSIRGPAEELDGWQPASDCAISGSISAGDFLKIECIGCGPWSCWQRYRAPIANLAPGRRGGSRLTSPMAFRDQIRNRCLEVGGNLDRSITRQQG
jgi:hypothetical protein